MVFGGALQLFHILHLEKVWKWKQRGMIRIKKENETNLYDFTVIRLVAFISDEYDRDIGEITFDGPDHFPHWLEFF